MTADDIAEPGMSISTPTTAPPSLGIGEAKISSEEIKAISRLYQGKIVKPAGALNPPSKLHIIVLSGKLSTRLSSALASLL
jgi:hypothetical protein